MSARAPDSPRSTPIGSDRAVDPIQSDPIEEAVALRKAELDEARSKLTMLASPLTVWKLFGKAAVSMLGTTAVEYGTSREAKVCYVGLAAYLLSKNALPELYAPPTCCGANCPNDSIGGALYAPSLHAYDFVWWLVLGILSSIGFGTGLHSGIMFLWPHVISVIIKAETSQSTRFPASYNHPCFASPSPSPNDDSYSNLNTLLLVLPAVIFWGSGTAIGELPPYFITRAAKRSGKGAIEMDSELKEAEEQMKNGSIVAWLKVKTIDFTRNNGFVGILLLASWPNAAFDMCGMACGWLDMPFWTFFGATLIGKGFIKVTLQSTACIGLFGPKLFTTLLTYLPALKVPALMCKAVGKTECTLASLLQTGRDKALLKFKLQNRLLPKDLVDAKGFLTEDGLVDRYCTAAGLTMSKKQWSDPAKHAQFVEKAKRAFEWLDTASPDGKRDSKLSAAELGAAVSLSDGKVSLDALDPGTGNILSPGNLWNGFILLLVLFFVYSIVEQVAINSQASSDSAALDEYEAKLQAGKREGKAATSPPNKKSD